MLRLVPTSAFEHYSLGVKTGAFELRHVAPVFKDGLADAFS